MTTDSREWGPRLYAYLEDYWREQGTNANAWTAQHPGVQGPTVSRWKVGAVVPSLQAMQAVADALGVTMLDVLIAAGVVDVGEVGRDAARAVVPDIDSAIAADPALADWQRRNLREFLDALRRVEAGAGQASKTRAQDPRRPRTRK